MLFVLIEASPSGVNSILTSTLCLITILIEFVILGRDLSALDLTFPFSNSMKAIRTPARKLVGLNKTVRYAFNLNSKCSKDYML